MDQEIKDNEERIMERLARDRQQVTQERQINEKLYGPDSQAQKVRLQKNLHDLQSQLYYSEIEVKNLWQTVAD